jgi:hypothetical protein
MRSATFWVFHTPSKSRALVEFGLIDKKIKLLGICFTHGNVVELTTIRDCREHAKKHLIYGDFLPPFIG